MPTYDEVTAGVSTRMKNNDDEVNGSAKKEDGGGAPAELEDDDEFDEVVERFESSYNFRFEEPYVLLPPLSGVLCLIQCYSSDAPVIPSFPRSVPTVRRPAEHTERRKEARERRKQRKEEELRVKREEVKRLKGLKLRELQGRLEKVSKEGGWKNSKGSLRYQLLLRHWLIVLIYVL